MRPSGSFIRIQRLPRCVYSVAGFDMMLSNALIGIPVNLAGGDVAIARTPFTGSRISWWRCGTITGCTSQRISGA